MEEIKNESELDYSLDLGDDSEENDHPIALRVKELVNNENLALAQDD